MMDYGIQLFGCMPLFRESPEKFLMAVAGMGYSLIEPCILFGDADPSDPMNERFWKPDELSEYKRLMDRYGLRVDSFHAFGNLTDHFPQIDRAAEFFNIRFLVMNTPKPNNDDTEEFLDVLNAVAAHMKEKEVRVLLHNHAEAISYKVNGITFLEMLLQRTKQNVGAQVDVGWVLYGGEDPLDYVRRIGSYCAGIHYKDIKRDYDMMTDEKIHTCLGEGALDAEPLIRWAAGQKLPQIVDQDMSEGDFMTDFGKSINIIKKYSGDESPK